MHEYIYNIEECTVTKRRETGFPAVTRLRYSLILEEPNFFKKSKKERKVLLLRSLCRMRRGRRGKMERGREEMEVKKEKKMKERKKE